MSLLDKFAIVTGAAQGLGKAFTEILLEKGAKVVLVDINKELGSKTASDFSRKYGHGRTLFIHCDVTSPAQMKESFKTVKDKYGRLDIMINNAGVGYEMGDLWEKTVDVNVKGTFRGTMLAIDLMRRDKKGHGGVIVNVASLAGVNPNPCGPVYGATKSAIIMFSQSWAKNPEMVANGVRINVLAPAFVETEMMAKLADRSTIHVPHLADHIITRAGIMRPETVAEGLLDLVTDQTKNGVILKMSKTGGKEYTTL